jgi:aryl-alcohol dehydrogenase-like predicted oxidoreductase
MSVISDSEVDVDTIKRAVAVHAIVDLQIEYSLIERRVEGELLNTCRQLGVAITAYGVLARGLLGGHLNALSPPDDSRRFSPRFHSENFRANLELAARLRAAAEAWRATPAQAAIAWVMSQSHDVIPLIGARDRGRLNEAIAALTLEPSAADLRSLDAAAPSGSAVGPAFPPDHPAGEPVNKKSQTRSAICSTCERTNGSFPVTSLYSGASENAAVAMPMAQ